MDKGDEPPTAHLRIRHNEVGCKKTGDVISLLKRENESWLIKSGSLTASSLGFSFVPAHSFVITHLSGHFQRCNCFLLDWPR